jgi:hypothetical protein
LNFDLMKFDLMISSHNVWFFKQIQVEDTRKQRAILTIINFIQ